MQTTRRLGPWQQSILADARQYGVVTWSEVQPRGRAREYSGRYRTRFIALGSVPGYQIGPYGPRGGLALRYVG